MKTSQFAPRQPRRHGAGARLTLLAGLLLAGAHASAASEAVASSRLPLVLLMVPLLAAFGFALRAWFPRLRAPSAADKSRQALDWPRLAQLSGQFFDAHGLEGFDPQARWDPARDLVLRRDRHACLVRARFWNARQVDAAAVQQLARDAARAGAGRGILLCARDVFTPTARQLARQQGVLLLDAAHMPTRATARSAPSRAAAAARGSRLAPLENPVSDASSRLAPLLGPDTPVRARREFQPTEPLETASVAIAATPEQPTVVLPRKAPLLAERPPIASRREFQPTEPLSAAGLAAAEQPTLVLPRGTPLLAGRPSTASRRAFQPTEPLPEQAVDAPAAVVPVRRAAPRHGERPAPSRREFMPTSPMPVSSLAAL